MQTRVHQRETRVSRHLFSLVYHTHYFYSNYRFARDSRWSETGDMNVLLFFLPYLSFVVPFHFGGGTCPYRTTKLRWRNDDNANLVSHCGIQPRGKRHIVCRRNKISVKYQPENKVSEPLDKAVCSVTTTMCGSGDHPLVCERSREANDR